MTTAHIKGTQPFFNAVKTQSRGCVFPVMIGRPMYTGDAGAHTEMHTDVHIKCPLCLNLTRNEISS